MVDIGLDEKVKVDENGRVIVYLSKTNKIAYATELMNAFLDTEEKSYLNKAIYIVGEKEVKKFLKNEVEDAISNITGYYTRADYLERVLRNLETIEKIIEIDRNKIKEKLKGHEKSIHYYDRLKLVFTKLNYTEEEKERVIEEIIPELINDAPHLSNTNFILLHDLIIDNDLRKYVVKAMEERINILIFNINRDWKYFVDVGRGWIFDDVRSFIICLGSVYEHLSDKLKEKIREYFLTKKDDIEKMFKRRFKKEEHKKYLEVLAKITGDGNLISYFI